jgi:hypothetical protein
MGSKYPNWSPYHYVARNPIRLIDPNGAEVAFAEGDNEAREFHKKHYSEYNEEDGSKNEFYNKEYVEIYDKLNKMIGILFYINHKVNSKSERLVDFRYGEDKNMKRDEKGQAIVDIFYGNPADLHGGTALHSYMEEIYHCKQMLDVIIRGEKDPNKIAAGSITNEVEAKKWVANNFKGYQIETPVTGKDYDIPTEMGVMGGYYPQINPSQFLKEEMDYIPYKNFSGIPPRIGGHYNNFPLK